MFLIATAPNRKDIREPLNPRERSILLKLPSFTADVTVEPSDDPAVSTTEMFAVDTAKSILMSILKVFVVSSFSFNAKGRNVAVSVMFVMMTSPGLTLASPLSRVIDS
jgi:hypothetical protein